MHFRLRWHSRCIKGELTWNCRYLGRYFEELVELSEEGRHRGCNCQNIFTSSSGHSNKADVCIPKWNCSGSLDIQGINSA